MLFRLILGKTNVIFANEVHAIAWQALSKLSAAEDIRFTSAWSGCASFSWLQNNQFFSFISAIQFKASELRLVVRQSCRNKTTYVT
jgi:hypothetical protein